jgi:protein-S-isoprenylcysteine O-methyltransferase Ste14
VILHQAVLVLWLGSEVLIGISRPAQRFEVRPSLRTDADHAVVQAGPYRFVRHPAYSGAHAADEATRAFRRVIQA